MSVPKDIQLFTSSRLSDVLSAREVDEYLRAQASSTPFDSWAWLAAADAALPDDEKCLAVARTQTGELLGWLPLRRASETFLGLKIPVLRPLTDPKSDRHSLQVPKARADVLGALVRATKSHKPGWAAILLDEMSGAQFQEENLPNWSMAFKRNTPVYFFPAGDEGAGAAKLIGKRGRRARKKLEKLAHAFKVWRPSREELAGLMEEIRAVEIASWKGERGVGIFSSDASFQFFCDVASGAAEAGTLMIATVHVDGKLASYRFGFVWRDVFYDYNFAYLPEFSNLSLGRVLLDELIVRGAEMGLRGIDGSRVGEAYENLLRERSAESVEHRRIMHFRWTLGGALLRSKFLILKPVKRALKKLLKPGR